MKNHSTPPDDDSWESDPVWKLLDQATPVAASRSFADDVVRMAKLQPVAEPWWRRWWSPVPVTLTGGAVAGLAALALSFNLPHAADPENFSQADDGDIIDPFAELQDFAEVETLMAAADHLDVFSDQELAGLIGF